MKTLWVCLLMLLSSPVMAQFAPTIDLSMDNLNAGGISGITQNFGFLTGEEGPASMELTINQGEFDFAGVQVGDVVGTIVLSVSIAFPPISGTIVAESVATSVTADHMEADVTVISVSSAVVLLLSTLGLPDPTGMLAFAAIYDNDVTGATMVAVDQGVLPTGTSTIDLPIVWETPGIFRQAAAGGVTTLVSTLVSPSGANATYSEDFTLIGQGLPNFKRGDVNDDGQVQIGDVIGMLGYLFSGAADPVCFSALDVSDDGAIGIGDAIGLLGYLFSGDPEPAAPGVNCGADGTPDSLGCAGYTSC